MMTRRIWLLTVVTFAALTLLVAACSQPLELTPSQNTGGHTDISVEQLAEMREDEGQQYPGGLLDRTFEITFTPVSTIHLSVVLHDYVANAYYVSNRGDDGNVGQSWETAFRSIGRALEVVQPGDTILILAGIYNEALVLENAGNSLAPITIRGAGGVAVLDGQETMSIGFWCENCSNFTFENLEIHGYTDIGIGVSQSSNIVMRNLKVHHNGFDAQLVGWEIEGYGINVDESQKITIESNEVYQNGPQPRPWGALGTGIDMYACTDCVIRDNHSHDNIGGGILVEDSVNVLVEENDVIANYLDATEDEWWDGGIWVDGGHDVTVRGNTFRNNLGPGIQISDEDHQQPYGYVFENNTSTENYYGIYVWNFGTSDFPSESILRMSNNQISGNTVQDIWIVPWECPPPDPCE